MKTEIKKWKKIKSKKIIHNKHVQMYQDLVKLPSGQLYDYFVVGKRSKAVLILPMDDKGRILISKEYRYPLGKVIYQSIGGSVENKEKPLVAAKRELKEESGYTAKKFQLLGNFYVNPSLATTVFYAYLATDLTKGEPEPDQEEFIESEFVTQKKFKEMIKKGEIMEPFLMDSFLLYQLKFKK